MRRVNLLLAVFVVCALGASARADDWGEYSAAIVNGVTTNAYPSTGALLYGNSADSADIECSGILIGCQTFLTAGHCVCDSTGSACQGGSAPNPANYFVYLQHGGIYAVGGIAIRSDFKFPVGDVAVIHLTTPVTGIKPSLVNTDAVPATGSAGVIAGFGRSSGTSSDYGLLRRGSVATAPCANGVSNTTSVCWNFRAPLGAPGTNSNTCQGDSGGPLFVDFGSGPVVAGVTSGGQNGFCRPDDESYDANVFQYRTWIATQAGSDLGSPSCGTLPQVGANDTSENDFEGALAGGATARHSFSVPEGASVLRVTMNSTSDFDLYVKAGGAPTTSDADCRRDGSSGFAACEFSSPSPGEWDVLVVAYGGSGSYQVTASQFGLECADPAKAGQACDDGNPCTTGDVCQSSVCVGTPVPDGAACNDADLCTNQDQCRSGVCQGDDVPRSNCHASVSATAGSLHLRHDGTWPDTLTWNWLRGDAVAKSEFGDPRNATPFALCVYDAQSGVDRLVLSRTIPPGGLCGTRSCWSATTRGFRYSNRQGTPSGITQVNLLDGASGRSQVTVRGRGASLQLPALPLQQDPRTTVQVVNDSACWEARYTTNSRNTAVEFRAHPGP